MEQLLRELAELREQKDKLRPALNEAKAIEDKMKIIEGQIRAIALNEFLAFGDVSHPAVGIRKTTVPRYEPGTVIEWAIEHYTEHEAAGFQFLMVDEEALIQAVKKGQISCVHIVMVELPTATISTKITRILDEMKGTINDNG
jgi:hypothetical protein